MSGRVRERDLDDLDALPSPCRGCMFWASARAEQGRAATDPTAQDAWWRSVQLDWGTPAKGVWHHDALVAFALYAPADHLRRLQALPVSVSDDALVLATLWTHPDGRGHGHARTLMQVVAREAQAHGHRAVEAITSTMATDGGCVLRPDVLEHLGFEPHRQHPSGLSVHRLDLDRTISWPSHVGHAIGEVIASLQARERAQPRPALEASGDPQP